MSPKPRSRRSTWIARAGLRESMKVSQLPVEFRLNFRPFAVMNPFNLAFPSPSRAQICLELSVLWNGCSDWIGRRSKVPFFYELLMENIITAQKTNKRNTRTTLFDFGDDVLCWVSSSNLLFFCFCWSPCMVKNSLFLFFACLFSVAGVSHPIVFLLYCQLEKAHYSGYVGQLLLTI